MRVSVEREVHVRVHMNKTRRPAHICVCVYTELIHARHTPTHAHTDAHTRPQAHTATVVGRVQVWMVAVDLRGNEIAVDKSHATTACVPRAARQLCLPAFPPAQPARPARPPASPPACAHCIHTIAKMRALACVRACAPAACTHVHACVRACVHACVHRKSDCASALSQSRVSIVDPDAFPGPSHHLPMISKTQCLKC